MFGRRVPNFYINHSYPDYPFTNETGFISQNYWRQQQFPYYPANIAPYNHQLQQQPFFGNQTFHPDTYPYAPSQNMMHNQYQNAGFNMHQTEMQMPSSNYTQSIFQNPLEPEQNQMAQPQNPYMSNPYMNPYPKQSFVPKQPSGVQSIMNSFKAQDGSIDINKMMNTAGQMMNAVNQVSSLVKGLGGMIKV
ncbi:YppG family protein [Cytobacillus dafuensis]|uniref:Spore coat protein n=1 Tax=Cytobacillus dafuensis TaxID=1742359 RepID=A0A5B8Z5R5_CYTDA|nr:YppG family protein [Cytobacillus dafuensis]QED48395.1 hypothetical protein FSZ17_14740 [Cytobacillus dafuensis]